MLKDQGLDDKKIEAMEKNMIYVKSLAAVKDSKKREKDKMKQAQDCKRITSKVSTRHKKSSSLGGSASP